jgi:transcriptional regulator with XRE-family HTH domain
MYGSFIKQARLSRGLTQVQLSRIVGIEQPNLSAYENNRQMPSADALNRILAGCGYHLEATAGARRIVFPLPNAGWFTDEQLQSEACVAPDPEASASIELGRSDELSAVKLEQVLALADSIRWAKAEP